MAKERTLNQGQYCAVTRDIAVRVEPTFLPQQSDPDQNYFVWAYNVQIENQGADTVQLLNRHWRITDAQGRVQEVNGSGVVGEQPILAPGETFEYTSGAPLPTPSGIMSGHYEMTDGQGRRFSVEIPAFSLDSPYDRPSLN